MIVLILLGAVFVGGWITLINLAVRNEVRFEDKQIEEMRELRERSNDDQKRNLRK